MMDWIKYPDLDYPAQLPKGYKSLVGRMIFVEEKRDGSNIAIWFDDYNEDVVISSRRQKIAHPKLQEQVKATEDYWKIRKFVIENPNTIVYAESIPKGYTPTKIEPPHDKPELVVFDILALGGFLNPIDLSSICRKYGFSMVRVIEIITPKTVDEIKEAEKEWHKWCIENKREGVVGKAFSLTALTIEDRSRNWIYFKSKPPMFKGMERAVKKSKKHKTPTAPPLPAEKIMRAINNCFYAEFQGNLEQFKDKKRAMPLVAKYVAVEAREHGYGMPKGGKIHELYLKFLEVEKNEG